MKKIFLLLPFFMLFSFCNKQANEKFIGLCIDSNQVLQINYFDWSHGISKIQEIVKGDTLFLDIQVAIGAKQDTRKIKLDSNIKNVKIASKSYEVKSIDSCSINNSANKKQE